MPRDPLKIIGNTADRRKWIREGTINARNDWLKYTDVKQRDIYKFYQRASKKIGSQILEAQKDGVIPHTRLIGLNDSIKYEMTLFRKGLSSKIKDGMISSIDQGVENSMIAAWRAGVPRSRLTMDGMTVNSAGKIIPIAGYTGPSQTALATFGKINKGAMDFVFRYRPGGVPFSDAIWEMSYSAQKNLLAAVNQAVMSGKSVDVLAREIQPFLLEPNNLFRRVRNKLGELVPSRPMSEFTTQLGVYKSSYQNAFRLAQTEMARAYHEGTIRYAREKNWAKGFIWRSGTGEPCPECASLEGQTFGLDDVPPIVHPNCMCYLELVIDEDAFEGEPSPEE